MNEPRAIQLMGQEYCLIELLPFATWDESQAEMTAIEAYIRDHRGEAGWTDAFKLLKAGGGGVESIGCTAGELGRVVGDLLPPFSSVEAPEGPAWSGTLAWGPDKRCVLFADHDESDRVQHLFLRLDLRGPNQLDVMAQALGLLVARWPLLLADWRWCCLVDLRDAARLREYLEMRRGG